MQLTPYQIAAVALAVLVVAWPQVQAWLGKLRSAAHFDVPHAAGSSAGRSSVVTDGLRLQEAAKSLGNEKAAALFGQAVVAMVDEGQKR